MNAAPSHSRPDAAWRRKFRERLRTWYRRNARSLPWKETRDPYRIWISEIMLQQTQVATVIDYYQRFLKRFPDVQSLAAADEQEVLRLWEGLGYYRRAKQMRQAAIVLADQYQGEFPQDVQAIHALPGVGRYTAGAIASFAWDFPAPIVEANTQRLYCRLLAYPEDPTRTAGQRLLWTFAEELLPRKDAGEFNQALMDLGRAVCSPRSPDCENCPIQGICPTEEAGLQATIPAPKKKMQYEEITEAAVVVRDGRKVLLRRCGEGERWAGLWDFPRFAVQGEPPQWLPKLAEMVRERTAVEIELGESAASLKHGVTRFRITLHCYWGKPIRGSIQGDDLQWTAIEDLEAVPLSATGRKLCRMIF